MRDEHRRPPARPSEPVGSPSTELLRGARHSARLTSAQLFGPRQEIQIEHGEAVYRLRITSQGKLILTK
jgi:hemin uptake protein HemP